MNRKSRFSVITFLLLGIIPGLAQREIKAIIEYDVTGDSLVKTRSTYFDRRGNVITDTTDFLFDPINNSQIYRITKNTYEQGRKSIELIYDCYVNKDTNVVRSFSRFNYDEKTGAEIQRCYESDSLLRFVRTIKREKGIITQKTESWEFNPVDKENEMPDITLSDTIYIDEFSRPWKIISNRYRGNAIKGSPVYRTMRYTSDSIYIKLETETYQKSYVSKYPKLQQRLDSIGIKYTIEKNDKYKYEILYFDD